VIAMSLHSQLLKWIKKNAETHLELLCKFLALPSVTCEKQTAKQCASWLGTLMQQYGIETKVFEAQGNPILVGEKIIGQNKPTVLFYGHYDVQPAEPLEDWVSPPFSPDIRDNRVFARGAADDKGQILSCLLALRALDDLSVRPLANVKFLFEGEEEEGSPHLAEFVEEHRQYLKADFAIAVDGNRHYSDKPTLIFGVRGGLWVELSINTSQREFHVSYEDVVPNAAEEVTRIISSLTASNGLVTLPGFYDDIIPPSQTEQRWLEDLRFDSNVLASESGRQDAAQIDTVEFYRKMMFSPTLTVTGVSAGYVGSGTKAAIPTRGMIKVDIRLAPNQDPDKILESLNKHLGDVCPEASLKLISKLPPSRTNVELTSVKQFICTFVEIMGNDVILIPSFGGSGPHYVFLDILKVPFVWMPLAWSDCKAHGANENLSVTSFQQGIEIVATLLTSLGIEKLHKDVPNIDPRP